MGKKKFILGTIVVSIIALYLLFLSIDVFRLQRHNPMEGTYAVRVFIYGWHTGLVLDTGNIPAPYHKYFAMYSRKHRWLEISWGDNLFYRNRNPEKEWLLAFRAIAWPTNSVLHVMGFDMPLDHLYRQNSLITFYVSRQHYLSLIRFVSSCFISGPGSAFTIMGRGLYGDSYFLKSRGKYVFPFTCNVWTARALKAAGIPLTPVLYQSSGLLMQVLREHGKKHAYSGKNLKYVLRETGRIPEPFFFDF